MNDFENDQRESIEDNDHEFDSEDFEQEMQEFGIKMRDYSKKIKESVEKSVNHLTYNIPHIHRINMISRAPGQNCPEDNSREDAIREKEKELAKARAPLEKIELLKELLDEGRITQKDYDVKKRKILDEI